MKTLVKYLLLLSYFCFSSACDKDDDTICNSRPPVCEFYVYVEDAETGADLLNPEVEGNIVSDRIHMDIDGESYYVENRAYGPSPYILTMGRSIEKKYYLCASGFLWDRATFGVLDLGDGTQNTFVYYPVSNGDWSLWIDGVKGDRDTAIIRR